MKDLTLGNTVIDISSEDISTIEKFSAMVDSSWYAVRDGQCIAAKRDLDQCVGKIAEIAVFKYAAACAIECTYPDFGIRTTEEKKKLKFDPDLYIGPDKKPAHVKGCEERDIFPISWVFQMGDPLMSTSTDRIILVTVNKQKTQATVRAVIAAPLARKYLLFKDLFKQDCMTKRAIYLSDLQLLNELPEA